MVAGDLKPTLKSVLVTPEGIQYLDAPEVDALSVGDTTLDATTPVGLSAQASIGSANKRIIVLATGNLRASESRTNLKGLGGRDRKHSVSELSLELVKDGFPKTSGDVSDDASDSPSDRVLCLLGPQNPLKNK